MNPSTSIRLELSLLEQQREIQDRCYHPQGGFEPFNRADIEQSIADRFEQQVSKFPDHLAIKSGEQALTYSQLNQIANQIARTILAAYDDNQSPIALLLEHGIPMVCGIFRCLRYGGRNCDDCIAGSICLCVCSQYRQGGSVRGCDR